MTPLYTNDEFFGAKSLDYVKLKCEYCGKEFYAQKKYVVNENDILDKIYNNLY